MKFNEFAQRIGKVLLEGKHTSAFIQTLFEAILPEKYYSLVMDSENSFKAYYNGRASINALARKINRHVEVRLFAEYIKDTGKVAVRKLCEIFADVIPDIDEKNAGRKLAELFDEIITEAAAVRRKTKQDLTKKQNNSSEILEGELIADEDEKVNVNVEIEGEKKLMTNTENEKSNANNSENEDNNVYDRKSLHVDHVDQITFEENHGNVTKIGNVYDGLTINM